VTSFLALLADVAIVAVRVRGGASVQSVEMVANVGFTPAGSWLFRSSVSCCGSVCFDAVGHEDGRIKTEVEGAISEEGVVPSLYDVPDGDVEEDNVGVRVLNFAGEFRLNEVAIADELLCAVRECEGNSS